MEPFARVLADQVGVITRRQALAVGLDDNDLRRLLRRRDLVVVHPGTYVNQTGECSWLQRAWAAVLFAEPAALCHESALRAFEGPTKRPEITIHVAVDAGRRIGSPQGVKIHRMTHLESRTLWGVGPPRLRFEEVVLDLASAACSELEAIGELAAACQTRRTTAARLLVTLGNRRRSVRRTFLSGVLADVGGGACSVLEHAYLTKVERAHGLPPAQRQVRANVTLGIIYRDARYDDLYVELDGLLFHDSTGQRDRDMDRDLDAAVEGRTAIRIGYGQVFARPCATARRLAILLQQHG